MRKLIATFLCLAAPAVWAEESAPPTPILSTGGYDAPPPVVVTPPPTPGHEWDGLYWGLSIGSVRSSYLRDDCCPGPGRTSVRPALTGAVGYNRTFNGGLAGVEGDFTFFEDEVERRFGFGPVSQNNHFSLRARLGAFTGPQQGTLFYGTAGYGWTHFDFDGDDQWIGGPTLGIGLESAAMMEQFGIGNGWRLKAEALYQYNEVTEFSQNGIPVHAGSENSLFRLGVNKNF